MRWWRRDRLRRRCSIITITLTTSHPPVGPPRQAYTNCLSVLADDRPIDGCNSAAVQPGEAPQLNPVHEVVQGRGRPAWNRPPLIDEDDYLELKK